MSKTPKPNKPTEAELAILQSVWRRGAATVREVHEDLGARTGYTTVLKLMQIMSEKGLVVRDESQRTHVYSPAAGEEQTQRRLVKDMIERVFNGSARKLVLHALSGRKATAQEIAEIRSLLDEMERNETPDRAKGGRA